MFDKWKYQRQAARVAGQYYTHMQNKGYSDAGASYRKKALKGFTAQSGSPHEDIDWNNATLRQRGRILTMSSPVAKSAVVTNRTNVVGTGLRLKSRIDYKLLGMTPEQAAAWQNATEAEFALWAENKNACDATGVNDFYAMQQLALASWLASGDSFAVVQIEQPTLFSPYSLRLHIIEADRICTKYALHSGTPAMMRITDGKNPENGNAIYDGVEVSHSGAIVAYWICNQYPDELLPKPSEWTRVEAYGAETGLPNILHIMDSERPDQYRGVSYLAPVIEPLLQLRRYTESELMAAVIESFFTVWIQKEAPAAGMPFNEPIPQDEQISDDENEYEMGPGVVNVLQNGETINSTNPTRPNSGFDAFMKAITTQVGAALEVPADLLLKQFNSSYSASRAAMLEAWKAFKMRRTWFVSDFCQPAYALWLTEAVARGRIAAPGFFNDPRIRQAWLGADWIGPTQGQLDPLKEIQAEQMANENGYSTRAQSAMRLNGTQYEQNVEILQRENAMLQAANVPAETSKGGTADAETN